MHARQIKINVDQQNFEPRNSLTAKLKWIAKLKSPDDEIFPLIARNFHSIRKIFIRIFSARVFNNSIKKTRRKTKLKTDTFENTKHARKKKGFDSKPNAKELPKFRITSTVLIPNIFRSGRRKRDYADNPGDRYASAFVCTYVLSVSFRQHLLKSERFWRKWKICSSRMKEADWWNHLWSLIKQIRRIILL